MDYKNIDPAKLVETLFTESPLELYDYILRGTLTEVYTELKKTSKEGWMSYSSLLIDKFAIHSSSFFHLSSGIIEHRKSGEQVRMNGYDLFTVNTTFRAIMETYATYHHLFVEPSSCEEKEFRFLLWKIDGLTEKSRFIINQDDFGEAKTIIENDKLILNNTISEFESCEFYKSIEGNQLNKIYNPAKKHYRWRFLFSNEEIIPLSITALITHVFNTRAFVNTYKHSSIHTHSNYYAIEEFETIRGKTLTKEYTDPLTRLAIITTAMLIDDICSMDDNAKLLVLPIPVIRFIKGISHSVRNFKES